MASSLLSTIGKIAVPAAITAGASIFSRPTSQQRQVTGQLSQLGQSATEAANQLRTTGTGLVNQGTQTLRQPIDYWSKILRGDQGAVTSALSPEISRINSGYEAGRRQLEMMPRGGGRSELLSQLPFQQARDVQTLTQQARPLAAQQLFGAGTQQQQTGSNLMTGSVNQINAATQVGRELLQQQALQRERDIETGRSIAQPIFDWFNNMGGKGGDGASWSIPGTDIGGEVGGAGIKGIPGAIGSTVSKAAGGVGSALGLGGGPGLLGLGSATIPVVGGVIAGGLLAKHLIGRGRRAADELTNPSGIQNAFEGTLQEIDSQGLPPDQAWKLKTQAYNELVQLAQEQAKKGGAHQKTVFQMLDQIAPYFGQRNPLRGAA